MALLSHIPCYADQANIVLRGVREMVLDLSTLDAAVIDETATMIFDY
jgi:hypothetical protein